MKTILNTLLCIMALSSFAQGPYARAAGELGSLAIHKDSSVFKDWATEVVINRGKQNISDLNSDTASVGKWSNALGKADGTSVVSLGDSGVATLRFSSVLYNGPGPDFAVFENAFNNTFLELAFVEVSSDGANFFRFPAHSLTDTVTPIGSFGSLDPSEINNLAGKYRANFGTPFDLEDLEGTLGLDLQNITHVRLVDAIGTLDSAFAQRDSYGRKINDIYPTAFPSGGFDLDAVGAIYIRPVGLSKEIMQTLNVYPNPAHSFISISGLEWKGQSFSIKTMNGNIVQSGILRQQKIDLNNLSSGIYIIEILSESSIGRSKFMVK
ncbi:MAG: T9SS type A sorting domain-containing protein [Flavobacteriales bacterium]|nr:T9SS type A sorting domain-containing protein [Flavobacteriales bacterium]